MALTYQEKITKLKEHANWLNFTDSQRVFLDGMAQGLKPVEAMKRAYPDNKSIVVSTKQMLSRVGIQQALALIEVDFSAPLVSRQEALRLLSRQLRKATDSAELVKLLSLYSKLAGWGKEEEEEPGEEVSLDKLVTAVERQRKVGNSGKGKENNGQVG